MILFWLIAAAVCMKCFCSLLWLVYCRGCHSKLSSGPRPVLYASLRFMATLVFCRPCLTGFLFMESKLGLNWDQWFEMTH